jgi:chromosome segregation ATPase
MNIEHKIRTPQKKYFVIFVCCITGLALAAFLIFGYLLREYITYAVDKQKAHDEILVTRNNHEKLKEYLLEQEEEYKTRLSDIKNLMEQRNNEIAQREAKIKSQQETIDEINVLSYQLTQAKNEYVQLQNNLKTASVELDASKSSNTTLVTINEDLKKKNDAIQEEHEARKEVYLKDIKLLEQIKEDKDKDIEKSSAQKTILETQTEKMNEYLLSLKLDIERLQTQLADEQLKLSSFTTQLTSLSNRTQQETVKLSKIISDQNDLQFSLVKDRLEKVTLSGEVAALQKKKVELQAVEEEATNMIKKMSQQKATLEGEIIGLQERVDAAQMALNKLKSQIKQEGEKQRDATENQLNEPAQEKDVNNVK